MRRDWQDSMVQRYRAQYVPPEEATCEKDPEEIF